MNGPCSLVARLEGRYMLLSSEFIEWVDDFRKKHAWNEFSTGKTVSNWPNVLKMLSVIGKIGYFIGQFSLQQNNYWNHNKQMILNNWDTTTDVSFDFKSHYFRNQDLSQRILVLI